MVNYLNLNYIIKKRLKNNTQEETKYPQLIKNHKRLFWYLHIFITYIFI